MQRQKDQENVLGHAGVFLGAFVSWWSRGHISVKNFTTMVNFVRKYPWSRRNLPWLKKLNTPPSHGHPWSRGQMFPMSDSHVVHVFNFLSKRTPMVSLCLTICPKGLPW